MSQAKKLPKGEKKKPRQKSIRIRQTPIFLGKSFSQTEIINGLTNMNPEARLFSYVDEEYKTPKNLRDMGLKVCSDCGHVQSDAHYRCLSCREILIAIPE